jgi:hypothetical protein
MACTEVQEFSTTSGYASNLMEVPSTLDKAPSVATYSTDDIDALKPPEWIRLYNRDKAYAAFVDELFSLDHEEDETPPNKDVVDWILESTVLAKKLLAQDWKKPHITSDDEGGVRLSWREGDRELRAIIPANLSGRYLYWQHANKYGGISNFASATLYSQLRWMNGRDR